MRLFGWLLATLAGGLIAGTTLYLFLDSAWSFESPPGWAWLSVAIVPSLSLMAFDRRLVRSASAIVGLQAILAGVLLSLNVWHDVAATWLLLDLVLAFALFGSTRGRRPGPLGRSTIVWLALIFGIGMPWAVLQPVMVAERAEAAAGGRPFCLQIADRHSLFDYEEVRSLFDLSGLRMRARRWEAGAKSIQFQYHAVLVVEGKGRFNWSYLNGDFLPEAPGQGAWPRFELYCQPTAHFTQALPVWTAEPWRTRDISIGQHRFAIPLGYRPSINRSRLMIRAVGPDYRFYDPAERMAKRYVAPEIYIRDRADDDLDTLVRHMTSTRASKAAGLDHGFERFDLSPELKIPNRLLVGTDAAGRATRVLHCNKWFARDEHDMCDFKFLADGLVITLTIADPGHWPNAEHKLVGLFRSFEKPNTSHGGAAP